MTRARIGDGNSFSTAYGGNYHYDGTRYVSYAELADPNSTYWRQMARDAVRDLSLQIIDNAEWAAFWDTISDDATSKEIADQFGAEISRRHDARIEEIKRANLIEN